MAAWTLLYHCVIGRREKETAVCRQAIESLQGRYPGQVKIIDGRSSTQNAENWRDYWHVKGDLISVDQDIEIDEHSLQVLLTCPHPACAFSYWMFAASTGVPEPYPTVRTMFSQHAAPGFCRLTEQARKGEPIPVVHWMNVEWHLDRVVVRNVGQWHNHGPCIPHHHGMAAYERAKREFVYA